MSRYLLFVILFCNSSLCISQQKVLLIGTLHRTENARLKDIIPVAAAVEHFQPGIICVEYPVPTDTASVMKRSVLDRNDAQIFRKLEALRKEWKIPDGDLNAKIESLQHPDLPHDVQKRMALQQLYFLSSDVGNADYQGYRVMKKIENDSTKMAWYSGNFPGFETMRKVYEDKRYRNNEYYYLVFPLAAKLNIPYLYPIDDLSTLTESKKPYDRLQVRDTMDVDKMKYQRYKEEFFRELQSLPKDSNQWIFSNSLQTMHDLLYVNAYKIDEDITNEDIKLNHHLWVQRNKTMAHHIDAVAREHPFIDIVVFFGAGHVGAVLEELNKLDKNYQVLTLPDVMK